MITFARIFVITLNGYVAAAYQLKTEAHQISYLIKIN